MFHYHWAVSCMIRKVSAEDIAIRGNGTGPEYMRPTRHFVYIFFNPVFQVSTAKNEINLFNNHILIVAPVTFAPAGAMTPSAEFLYTYTVIVLKFCRQSFLTKLTYQYLFKHYNYNQTAPERLFYTVHHFTKYFVKQMHNKTQVDDNTNITVYSKAVT